MTFQLSSFAFEHNGMMPSLYTCEGPNISPPLAWTDPPPGTRSLVLIVDDPDAPDPAAPKRVWVHWVLYNLPPMKGVLAEGVSNADLPTGTLVGTNDRKHAGYHGPCPPIGVHRYFHKLYALDTVLPDMGHATKTEVLAKMDGHVLAQSEIIGRYILQKKES